MGKKPIEVELDAASRSLKLADHESEAKAILSCPWSVKKQIHISNAWQQEGLLLSGLTSDAFRAENILSSLTRQDVCRFVLE